MRTFRQIVWNLDDTDRLVDQALRIARADGYAAGVDAERAHTRRAIAAQDAERLRAEHAERRLVESEAHA